MANIASELIELGSRNPLFIQMHSMRSRRSNRYLPTIDGNLNQTLHEIYTIKDNMDEAYVTVPKNVDANHMNDLTTLNRTLFDSKIKFIPVAYGTNAMESRSISDQIVKDSIDSLSKLNLSFDRIVCDFESYVPDPEPIYRFNISQDSHNDLRPIKSYFSRQVDIVGQGYEVFVLNESQRDFFKAYADVRNVYVAEKWFNVEYFAKQVNLFKSLTPARDIEGLRTIGEELIKDGKKLCFFPYRLTDRDYESTALSILESDPNTLLIVTDPNESFDLLDSRIVERCFNVRHHIEPTTSLKSVYYHIFSEWPITVPVRYDYSRVLHQSIVEMAMLNPARLDVVDPRTNERMSISDVLSSVEKFVK